MIDENALWYKRGDLVEFELHLGAGVKICRGLVLNTAVLVGRGARQVWIHDMDNATPELESTWTKRKHIVHEEDIISKLDSVLIGSDTLLRDNPVSFPVQYGKDTVEQPAIEITIALPVKAAQ